jgi:hypothetical protein
MLVLMSHTINEIFLKLSMRAHAKVEGLPDLVV